MRISEERQPEFHSLGKVAEIIMGQSPKGDTYNHLGEGVPLLNGPTEFGPAHPDPKLWTVAPTRMCLPGDILFCVRGSTTGRMNWADRAYCLGRGVGAFRAKHGDADTKFIYFSIFHNLPRLLSRTTGSVFPNLSRDDFASFEIWWPATRKREAIASILGSLDDKIELNRRMNETLEGMARAIFKSWFVDFDPVWAKKRGQKPVGMDAATAVHFPSDFEDSKLGKIPKGWKVTELPDVVDYLEGPGIRNWQYTNTENGTRFINIRCIQNRDLLIQTANRVSNEEAYGKYRHFLLKPNDIVVSTSGTLGRFAIVRQEHLPLMLNTSVIRFRPKPPLMSWAYLLGYVETDLQTELLIQASGSVQLNFGPMHLMRIKLLIPSEQVLDKHSSIVEPIIRKQIENQCESRTLAAIRDTLLPKLMSGELRVKDLEKFVGISRS